MSRVLHVSEFTKGGIETHLNEVLKYQSESHDIYLIVSEQNSNRDTLQISPDRLFLYPYQRKPQYFLKAMRSIQKTVNEINPDIVHVHGTFAGVFLRTLFFFKRKRPVVIYCSHGWAFLMDTVPWKRKLFALVEKVLSLRTDFIINISNHEYEMAMNYGLSSKKSVVVYNGVSDAPSSDHLPFAVKKEKINLLYVGRFDRQKGFDLLLEVFNEHMFADVTLYLVGDTVLKQYEFKFPDNAVKIGWVDNSEIDRYMKSCDAVIVPSRWEGFGIVAIEALRNKKPVIASNRGALPEIIQHGVNGYIFDFDNKEELVSVVRSLNKSKLAAMGEIGERIFYEKFHSDKMNKQIERLYEAAVNKPNDRYSVTVKKYV
ncbi:glycosyltransferase family 4 protein [Cohnella silvisoli]|uniref:Glycosyltransferase family 4 protein n=1 Tax=Cohnella silvisoli TaxID=2873699 RepID=A0ABV1KX71_9BACL|nr:glycosyltransferase family 4 protein [Cohnella silvisoli]MCD9024058.1 glycosyltransferase family 4 protein [Cohnella silvisoli]